MKKKIFTLKTLLSFVIIVVMIFSNTTPAYAWKVKTHAYSVNLIIDEIERNNGYVEIAPFGKFEVLQEYQNLIRIYPDFYRAGSVGPDVFPDIIIGQTIIHTGNKSYTSGQIIENLWNAALTLPESTTNPNYQAVLNTMNTIVPMEVYGTKDPNDPANKYLKMNNKMQAKAFILGFMAHAAGDYFGHSYINHLSGGEWPNMADGLNSSEKDIIRRHSVLEAYIDSVIPQEYKSNSKNTIKIPQRFVYDSMFVFDPVQGSEISNDHNKPHYLLGENVPPHLDLFFTIRDALKRRIIKIDENAKGDIIDKAAYILSLQFAQKAYCEAWMIDIDRGLGDWVAANERAAQQMLYENGNMDKYFDELNKWADKHALSMLGAPDVAVDILNKLGSVTDFIIELFPKSVIDVIEEAKKDINNYIIRKATGIDIKEYTTMLNPPLSDLTSDKMFPAGSFEKLKQEMGNFNLSTDANKQEFIPFMNTLTLTKLTLIGEDGIQELRKRAGSTNAIKFGPYEKTLTSFIFNMDYGYDWNEEALFRSGFFLTRSGEDQSLVTRVIFNLDGSIKPKFSDMTQGPIQVDVNVPYEIGKEPKIKVNYENAPDQVNAVIGLYPIDDYSFNTHNWKNIARNTSGEYVATAPLKGGKYHFRIYDNKYKLLATSEIIEIIEVKGELTSYFDKIPTQPLEPDQKFSFSFIDNLKTKGQMALYKDNEIDPQKIAGLKQTLKGTKGTYSSQDYAPKEPGMYRYRAYDENMVLVAESSLITVSGPPVSNIDVKPSNTETSKQSALSDIKTIGIYDITDYEGQNGTVFNVTVTGSLEGNVWGNGIYSSDSDVETAAVHAGIVKVGETKTIKITILPGEKSYEGTMRNGVITQPYEKWYGSYKFTDITLPLIVQSQTEALEMHKFKAEDLDLSEYFGLNGTQLNVIVTGTLEGNVWGSGIYTSDSDISVASVHAGIVKVGETKTVKITILPGQNSYVGTVKNGVESYDYEEWECSFKFTE